MTDRQQFRQALIQQLNQGLEGFDFAELRFKHAASEEVAKQAARDVFFSQCLKASEDWAITPSERQVLNALGQRLQLSARQQSECLMAAKNRVFDRELNEALDDEMISNTEANSLAHLRTTLGLAPMAAHEFGPPLKRPAKQREKLWVPRASKETRQSAEPSWHGPWGPRSPVLGIPYTVLVLTTGACLLVGCWLAYRTQNWWPIPLSLLSAAPLILSQFLSARCWSCGANWSMYRTASEDDFSFFGGYSYYVYYECIQCGAVRRALRRHRYRSYRNPWNFW